MKQEIEPPPIRGEDEVGVGVSGGISPFSFNLCPFFASEPPTLETSTETFCIEMGNVGLSGESGSNEAGTLKFGEECDFLMSRLRFFSLARV
jgi:hypothetical protein